MDQRGGNRPRTPVIQKARMGLSPYSTHYDPPKPGGNTVHANLSPLTSDRHAADVMVDEA